MLVKLYKTLSAKGENKLVTKDNIEAILSLPITWLDLDIFVIETASALDYGVSGVDYLHFASIEANSIREIISADLEIDEVNSIKRTDPLEYRSR